MMTTFFSRLKLLPEFMMLLQSAIRWRHSAPLLIATRIGYTAFIVLVSGYCILSYLPFTYLWVVHDPIFPFVRWFAGNYWWHFSVLLLAIATTLKGRQRCKPRTRRMTRVFLSVHALIAIVLSFAPPLSALPNDDRSLLYGVLVLFS